MVTPYRKSRHQQSDLAPHIGPMVLGWPDVVLLSCGQAAGKLESGDGEERSWPGTSSG